MSTPQSSIHHPHFTTCCRVIVPSSSSSSSSSSNCSYQQWACSVYKMITPFFLTRQALVLLPTWKFYLDQNRMTILMVPSGRGWNEITCHSPMGTKKTALLCHQSHHAAQLYMVSIFDSCCCCKCCLLICETPDPNSHPPLKKRELGKGFKKVEALHMFQTCSQQHHIVSHILWPNFYPCKLDSQTNWKGYIIFYFKRVHSLSVCFGDGPIKDVHHQNKTKIHVTNAN